MPYFMCRTAPGKFTIRCSKCRHLGGALPILTGACIGGGGGDSWSRDDRDWFAAHPTRRWRLRDPGPGELEAMELDGLAPERVIPYFLPRLFAEAGTVDMVDDLLALAKAFAPDVVVHDGFTFAAPLVAALLGVRAVHHTIGSPVDAATLETCSDVLSPLWRSMPGWEMARVRSSWGWPTTGGRSRGNSD